MHGPHAPNTEVHMETFPNPLTIITFFTYLFCIFQTLQLQRRLCSRAYARRDAVLTDGAGPRAHVSQGQFCNTESCKTYTITGLSHWTSKAWQQPSTQQGLPFWTHEDQCISPIISPSAVTRGYHSTCSLLSSFHSTLNLMLTTDNLFSSSHFFCVF